MLIDKNSIYKDVEGMLNQVATIFEKKESTSDFTKFSTDQWELKVHHSTTLIGYDFTMFYKNKYLGMSSDTDLYPLFEGSHIENTQIVVNEMKHFVNNFLTNRLYYGVKDKNTYFAVPTQNDNEYDVKIVKKNLLLSTVTHMNWSTKKVKGLLMQLKITND